MITGLKVVVVIPLTTVIVLSGYSLLLGWNLITLVIFWFLIVPFVILFLTSWLLKEDHITIKPLVSLIVFYSFLVWMIYKHFESDAFAIMMFSFLYNFLVMCLVMFVQRHDEVTEQRNSPR